MPLEVIAIHHITDEMVKGAPHALEVLPRFLEFIGDSMLVAHNAPFDISFIGCELDRNKLSLPESPVYDTVDIFHRLFPGLPSYSLLSLAHAFRIAETQEHRALADALYVRALMETAGRRLRELDNPQEVIRSFTVHRLSEWRGREIDLPAEFTDITVAMRHGLSLEILYASENSPPQRRIVHPRQVHARRANFYLLAYCELAQAERTFRLDRIQSFQLIEN
jgi:DNA polymerase III epsilon subunit-like protein